MNTAAPDVSTIMNMAGSRAADLPQEAEVFQLLANPEAQRRGVLERLAVAGPPVPRPRPRSSDGGSRGSWDDDDRTEPMINYRYQSRSREDPDSDYESDHGDRRSEHGGDRRSDDGHYNDDDSRPEPPRVSTRDDMLDDDRSPDQRRAAIPVEGLRERTERQALVEKLSVFEACGFKITAYDPKTITIEELTAMVKRRELIDSTMSYVDIAIDWIIWLSKMLEMVNGFFGILPMDNYAKQVEENTKKPRFKYALYCLIMKYGGAGSFLGPWKEIALVLALPILQAVAIKLIMLMSKARGIPMSADLVSMGVNEGANKINRFFGRTSENENDGGGVYDGGGASDASSDVSYDSDTDYFPSANKSVEIEEPPPFMVPN
jgi:hypothetical protein